MESASLNLGRRYLMAMDLLSVAATHNLTVAEAHAAVRPLGPTHGDLNDRLDDWQRAAKIAQRAVFYLARRGHRGPLWLMRAEAVSAIARREIR